MTVTRVTVTPPATDKLIDASIDERIDQALAQAQDLRDQADAVRAEPLRSGPLDSPDARVREIESRMATVSALLNSAVVFAAEAIVLSNRQARP